jgi:hypothetical protein
MNGLGLGLGTGLQNYVPFTPTNLPDLKLWLPADRIGVQGYSLDFDGTDDYVQADNEITDYPFTLECWVRLDVTNITQSILFLSKSTAEDTYYGLRFSNPDQKFLIIVRNTTVVSKAGTISPVANTWYHLALVLASETDRKMYVNGILDAEDNVSVSFSDTDVKVLMGLFRTTNPSAYTNGKMSDVRIWNTARTQQQIADNYQKRLIGNESGLAGYWKLDKGSGTTVADSTTNANAGTITGAIWDNSEPFTEPIDDGTAVRLWADQSGNGYDAEQATTAARPTYIASGLNGLPVVRFDGTDDRLSVPSSTATFKFLHSDVSTVFIVAKAGVVADPGVIYGFIHNGTGTQNIGFYIRYTDASPNNDRIGHNIYLGTVGQIVVSNNTSSGAFTANQFSFLTVLSKPSDAVVEERSAISINGGVSAKANFSTNTPSTSDASIDLTIGGSSTATVPFLNGDIAEIIVYNRALNTSELAQVHKYLSMKWGIQLA